MRQRDVSRHYLPGRGRAHLVAAAGQIAATRDEDAEGHVEHLVARRVGRLHWLAGRFLADVTLILVASLADEAADHTGLGFVQLLKDIASGSRSTA